MFVPAWFTIKACYYVAVWILILCSVAVSGAKCPWMCFCNSASKVVYCARRQLSFIPNSIPGDSIQLNLNGNLFKSTALARSNFTHFESLQHMYLSECGIETLEVDTFIDLVNLKWLDLSKNRIRVLEDYTFRGLNLLHLFLSANRNVRVRRNAFAQMQTTGLYLNECELRKLSFESLAPLNLTLQKLWLDGNGLKHLDKKFKYMFQTLAHLRLGSNPFHCNCELLWLKEFYDKQRGVFQGADQPQCITPHRLRDAKFDSITLFDFQCYPPVFVNVDAHFDHGRTSLKCTASGDPPPTLFWIRPRGQSKKFIPTHTEGRRKNTAEWHIVPKNIYEDLSGQYICLALNEAGNVTLTLNMTLPPKARDEGSSIGHSAQSASPPETPPPTLASSTPSSNFVVIHLPRTDAPARGYVTDRRPSTPGPALDHHEQDTSTFKSKTVDQNSSNRDDVHSSPESGERLFTLLELVGAIAGTFACTLIICVVILPIYYRRKNRNRHRSLREKPPPPPSGNMLYLPSMPDMEYMDSPNHVPKNNKPDIMEYLDSNYSTIK